MVGGRRLAEAGKELEPGTSKPHKLILSAHAHLPGSTYCLYVSAIRSILPSSLGGQDEKA